MEFALRSFTKNDADWLVAVHEQYYSGVHGFDASFGPFVAQILGDFLLHQDPATEAGWIAESDGVPLGSIFCTDDGDQVARLRVFYVVEEARGTGVAQALIEKCLSFARAAGYVKMVLWTHECLTAAGAIYRRNGFVRTQAQPVHLFGVNLVEEDWQIAL